MADLLYVAIMVVLTAIAILFVVGCDKIVGPDEVALAEQTGTRREREQRERQLEEIGA